jgi:uncharacterized membrane protein
MILFCLHQSSCGVLDKDVVFHKILEMRHHLMRQITFTALVELSIISITHKHVISWILVYSLSVIRDR